MSLLEQLYQKETWLEFLKHKQDSGFFWEDEDKALCKYIENEEYISVCDQIFSNEDFPLPKLTKINKKFSEKKRMVFIFGYKEKYVFRKQLDIAKIHNKPVIIHSRDASNDTLNILKEYNLRGSLHCYSGSLEMANEFIKLGYLLGVGGVVTYKNAKNIVNVIENIDISECENSNNMSLIVYFVKPGDTLWNLAKATRLASKTRRILSCLKPPLFMASPAWVLTPVP